MKIRFAILLGVVVGIGILHYVTPGHAEFLHGTYRRLSYFPIVLAALWFGMRGGLTIAVLSSIAFIPHLVIFSGHHNSAYLGEFMEILLYLAAGAVTGFIAGKEARLREKYQRLSEKLERSYEQLHEESRLLLEADEQLAASQKFSALGKLSASLAHEIKNPLSSIRGTAEIFLDEFPPDHPKREFGEILIKEVARLNATVEEVLQFARGQGPAGEDTEPLSEVLERVVRLVENQAHKKQIEIALVGNGPGDTFLVAGGKLSQVFLNILLNGIEAAPVGGRISMLLAVGEDGARVEICDNGPGVEGAFREKIFESFYSGKERGTGLGLSISRKIVESYGGSIICKGAESGGACFLVFLPCRDKFPGTAMVMATADSGAE